MDDFELDWYKANNAYKAPVDTFERDWQYSQNEYKAPVDTFERDWQQSQNEYRGPSYQAPSYDYGLPSFDYTPAPQYNTATLQTNAPWWQGPTTFASMGYGAPISPNQSFGGNATMQAGSGPQVMGGQTFAGPNAVTTAPTQGGATGYMGVSMQDPQNRNTTPALLESASVGLPGLDSEEYKRTYNTDEMMGPREQSLGQQAKSWVRDPENRDTVRLGIQGLSALAGYQAQRDAGKMAREQMGLQAENMAAQRAAYEREMALREEAMASQRQALGQNQQMAQRANQESIRSFDEARSLYNPQELGIRGMAQQRGATQRSIEDTRKALASRGMSAAAIEAEVRRQRVAGATGESAAYMRGLDTGRSAQAGALSSAKALGSTMPGLSYSQGPNAPTFTPNYSGAEYYSRQGEQTSQTLRDLLESYANYPTLRRQEEIRAQMQRESLK
jgi:hypothetical protein